MVKTILFIEDDLPTIEVYTTALEKEGFNVKTITFGREALEFVDKVNEGKEKQPDIVLLDIMLPDVSGLEVLKKIKSNKKTKNIPVLVLTNFAGKEEEIEKMRFDKTKYLIKTNYTPRQLVELIKKELKIK